MSDTVDASQDTEAAIKSVVACYNEAVRSNDAEMFRRAFHPTATVAHFQERKGVIDVKSLAEFIEQISALHVRFGNAVEISEDVHIDVSGHIASARVPFRFQMGDKEFGGVNIFTFAVDDGNWRIMGKVYSL